MKTNFLSFNVLLVFLLIFNTSSSLSRLEKQEKQVKNIVLMIGDGMGLSHIYAAMIANNGHLNLEKCKNTGFIKTHSASDFITDSGASSTAMSTGEKTYNKAIAVNTDTLPLTTILEIAEEHGLATGLVATSSITHSTPATFIAHQDSRYNYEDIAEDFLKTDIDVFIGGGREHFMKRSDSVDLTAELKEKGYKVLFNMDSIKKVTYGKLAGLTADEHNPHYCDKTGKILRGDMLPDAATTALNILSNNENGFFLMIEGSQIDWGGHENNTDYIIQETLDFDRTIGKVLDFAEKDGNTLVIITADHETGGMSINGGNIKEGTVDAEYTTTNHSGVMVPVFAFGPGSEEFRGIYENSDIFNKMMKAFEF
jgi:alkaline phosphatase